MNDVQADPPNQAPRLLAGVLGLALLAVLLRFSFLEPERPRVPLATYRLELSGGQGPARTLFHRDSTFELRVSALTPEEVTPDVVLYMVGVGRIEAWRPPRTAQPGGGFIVEGSPASLSLPDGTSTLVVVLAPPGALPPQDLLLDVLTGATAASLRPATVLVSPEFQVTL